MKKLSFIFALILTANTYSDGLNSYLMDVTTEYNLNTKNTKTTWNAGEGTYQLNDKYSFGFDVDRIYTDSKKYSDSEEIFTEFSIYGSQKLNENWSLYTAYQFTHVSAWTEGTEVKGGWDYQNDYRYWENLYASAYFGRNYTIKDKNYYVGIKLDQQLGGNKEESLTQSLQQGFASGINFFTGTTLAKNLTIDLSQYNLALYNEKGKDLKYQVKADATIKYTYPLKHGFSFFTEAYLESSKYFTSTEDDYVYSTGYIIPKIKYDNKINNKLALTSSIGYEILSYDYNKGLEEWDNNQVELIASFNYIP